MKYTPTFLILVLLTIATKTCQAQVVSPFTPTNPNLNHISMETFEKDSLSDFLKLRPTYKLLSCTIDVCNKGQITSLDFHKDKKMLNSLFSMVKVGTILGFSDIAVMNGDKKIHLTPKYYIIE
jgi:hypothetical protein